MEENKGLNISTKSFITATLVIFVLMVCTYLLTFIIPGGEYARVLDEAGNTIIDTAKGFTYVDGGISFVTWALSPVLVLFGDGSGSIIAVILFLLVIGGVFNSLDKCGLMRYMLDVITSKFSKNRYLLLAIVALFFMSLGAFIGSFEEAVPLVPIVVALAIRLGWTSLIGLGMSVLAIGCGFASGVCNPFTVGVAQELAGLPMFSGMSLRFVSFIIIYIVLFIYLFYHAKKVETDIVEEETEEFEKDPKMAKGLICFVGILCLGILVIFSSVFIPALQAFTMIIVAVMFLVAGIASVLLAGVKGKDLAKTFVDGVVTMLPAILMILMANSIKYTLVEAKILDTLLYHAVSIAQTMPRGAVILFIYFLVLLMNFFIPSGSAKAFLLMPLIVPVAQIFDISAQLCVMAFAFGDGFSNIFYPTNPVLLISLGVANVNYIDWVKWSYKFQLFNLIITSGILLFGLMIGY